MEEAMPTNKTDSDAAVLAKELYCRSYEYVPELNVLKNYTTLSEETLQARGFRESVDSELQNLYRSAAQKR